MYAIKLKTFILLASMGMLTACSTTGYGTANHNGKWYYFPPKCGKYTYSYSDPDKLDCVHKGNQTGQMLYPADSKQVDMHLQQEKNFYDSLNQMNQNRSKTTYCNQIGFQTICNQY